MTDTPHPPTVPPPLPPAIDGLPMCVCGHDAKAHLDFVQTADCLHCDCERFTPSPAVAALPDQGEEAPRVECDQWQQLRASKLAIPYLLYFPSMRDVARRHGYALAIHGSLTRDFDLIAVAWTPDASDAETLVAAICADNQLLMTVPDKGDKPHGRRGYTLQGIAGVDHGWVDLAVIPPLSALPGVSPTNPQEKA